MHVPARATTSRCSSTSSAGRDDALLRRRRLPLERRGPHARELRLVRRLAHRRRVPASGAPTATSSPTLRALAPRGRRLPVRPRRPRRTTLHERRSPSTRCVARAPRTCSGTALTGDLPHELGVTLVYGHTPRADFGVRWNDPFSIGIDTGAVYGGPLTAIRLARRDALPDRSGRTPARLVGC